MVANLNGNHFEDFKNCIQEGGIEAGRIAPRSNSSVYTSLNFQWQLWPPTITRVAYVVPKEEEDVGTIVSCGRKNNIRLVARSGGHSFEKYSFGDNNSIVIDLRNLNTILVDRSNSTAVIGAGALVGPIVMTLWNEARSFFPVSSCPTVGISGLATGGGYGFLARSHGMTADYIVGLRLVTSSGKSIVVNNVTHADMYWALRGGGAASFGIVTSFVMKILPAPSLVFYTSPKWDLSTFPAVFAAWQQFITSGPTSVTAKMDINSGVIGIFFADAEGTGQNFDAILQTFPPAKFITRQLGTYPEFFMSTTGEVKLADGTSLDYPQALLRLHRNSVPASYQVERSFYVEQIANEEDILDLHEILQQVPESVIISFQAYGGAINDLKPEDTSFVHRRGRLALGISSYHPKNDTELQGTVWVDKFFQLGTENFAQKESYQNYPDVKLADYLQSYYGNNLEKLIQVKKKYDQENCFYNPQ